MKHNKVRNAKGKQGKLTEVKTANKVLSLLL